MKIRATEDDMKRTFDYLVEDIKDWKEKQWLADAIVSHLWTLLRRSGYSITRMEAAEYVHKRFKEPT